MTASSKFPLAYCFGDKQKPMTQMELAQATPNIRLQSVWPALAARVKDFQNTLSLADKASFDFEDTLSELAVTLLERDSEWDPKRGKYITYAMTVANHALYAIRDKATVVHQPRNSLDRMKRYDAKDGADTNRKRKTANDIRRAARGHLPIVTGESNSEDINNEAREPVLDPEPDILEARELAEASADMVKQAIKQLMPLEARVIGRLFGLWGNLQYNEHLLGIQIGYTEAEIRTIKARAMAKMRKFLNGASK